jgi:hypothetical protein
LAFSPGLPGAVRSLPAVFSDARLTLR